MKTFTWIALRPERFYIMNHIQLRAYQIVQLYIIIIIRIPGALVALFESLI